MTTRTMSVPVQDPIEHSLGISSYLSPHIDGFSAVLKARYSDFCVHEVHIDGSVACLTSVGTETTNSVEKINDWNDDSRKRKHDFEQNETEKDWSTLSRELENLIGQQDAVTTIQFLQESKPQQQYIRLPHIEDKDKRRELHHWIRSRLQVTADTMEDGDKGSRVIRIWHPCYEDKVPKKFEKNRRPKPDKKYLQFVLYKENIDTAAALNQIQRRFGKRPIRMGYAGMKDKRGVTAQFITVPSHIPESLLSFNHSNASGGGHTKSKGVAVVRCGNFSYTDTELRLGRLHGNRFDIVLRNVKSPNPLFSKERLRQAAEALRTNGFINYFGTQRFGKFQDTHLTGIAIINGDFEAAINIIMQPKTGEREEVTSARRSWQTRFEHIDEASKAKAEAECAKKIIRDFGRFMASEISILNSLARYPLEYKKAFSCINKTMRMMFLHALQSYLWNHVATYRISTMGTILHKGDLVFENPAISETSEFIGIPSVKVLTDQDLSSGRYSIEDIVLPLIGSKTQLPDNDSTATFNRILSEHGLTKEMLTNVKDRDLDLSGDYRKVICHPNDVEYSILEYCDPLQPLIRTDLMKLENIELDLSTESSSDKLLAMVVGFTLPASSYATIAIRELTKLPTSSDYQKDLELDHAPEMKLDQDI